MPGGYEWLIILAVIALLFGGAKLPKLARSLGSAKGEFEKGLKEGQAAGAAGQAEATAAKAEATEAKADAADADAALAEAEAKAAAAEAEAARLKAEAEAARKAAGGNRTDA